MNALEYRALVNKLQAINEGPFGDDAPQHNEPPLKIGDIDPRNGQKILSALTSGDGTVVRSRFGDIWNVKYGPADTPAPVAEPVAPVEEPVAPVTEPVAPVEEPVAPVEEPVAPVTEPAKDPVKPTQSGMTAPTAPKNVGTVALQYWLNAHGAKPTLKTDGQYGKNTDAAVKSLAAKMGSNPEYKEMVAAGTAYRTPGGVERVSASGGADATLVKYGFDPHTGQPKDVTKPAQGGVYPTQDAAAINKSGWKAATQPVKPRPTTNPMQQQVWDSNYAKMYNWDGSPRKVALTDPSKASTMSEALDELAQLRSSIDKILGKNTDK